jgi:hypothetical protein
MVDAMKVLGREHEIDLPAISVTDRNAFCCSMDGRWSHRYPLCIITESFTSPIRSFRAQWKASRSAIFILRKFGWPSVRLIMTGASCGGWGGGGGQRSPKAGKSENWAE